MKEIINEYAEALFAIASESNEVEKFSDDLCEIRNLTEENEEYLSFLSCPSIPLSERISSIDEAFSENFHPHTVSFIKILTEKGRIKDLVSCIDEFINLKLLFENTETIKVISKIPLTDSQKEALVKKLSVKQNKNINAIYETDETLIGGIKIVAGDLLIDGSIKSRLKDLKEVIEK